METYKQIMMKEGVRAHFPKFENNKMETVYVSNIPQHLDRDQVIKWTEGLMMAIEIAEFGKLGTPFQTIPGILLNNGWMHMKIVTNINTLCLDDPKNILKVKNENSMVHIQKKKEYARSCGKCGTFHEYGSCKSKEEFDICFRCGLNKNHKTANCDTKLVDYKCSFCKESGHEKRSCEKHNKAKEEEENRRKEEKKKKSENFIYYDPKRNGTYAQEAGSEEKSMEEKKETREEMKEMKEQIERENKKNLKEMEERMERKIEEVKTTINKNKIVFLL